MKTLLLENTNIRVLSAAGATEFSTDMHHLKSSVFTDDEGTDYLQLEGDSSTIIVEYTELQDEEGNTFASANDAVVYSRTLQNQTPELGEAIKLGNIELRSTGQEILQVNNNTGTKTLNVFQEVTAAGTQKVFFRNQDNSQAIDEDVTTAYNPLSVNTGASVINAQGRYVIVLDILVSGSKFVAGYRSKSQTGIQNGNIKVFNITQNPVDVDKYNVLTGTDISAGWYVSKKPHWKFRTTLEIQNSAGFNLGTGDIELPINTGFELTDGEVYRFVISADNQFTMDGYDAGPLVTGVEGATQFVPYLERSYIGQQETLVMTQGSINLLGREIDFIRDHTDTSILIDIDGAGYSYAVNSIQAYEENGKISIGHINGGTPYFTNISHDLATIAGANTYTTLNAVINALNALFQVTPLGLGGDYISTLPVLDGVDITANFAEGQTPITGDLYGVNTDTSQHGARVWSDETIDESNEYYEVKITGKGQFMLGLYSVDDGDLAEITNNSGNGHSGYKWANAFYNYGSYIAPWTIYGSNSSFSYGPGWSFSGNDKMLRYKQQLQDNFANGDPVLFKVGIGANGHIEVYYFDEGVTNQYIMTARSSYTLPTGQYGLLVKLVNGTARLVETPKRVATDPVAPILTYYFIESPDTEFSYPLFATEEEANYIDTQNGGSGTSHTHVYVDDPTNTVWYMPDTGGTMNGATAPSNSANVTYNEIATQNDDLFAPVAFSDQTITVNEGDALNLQLHPVGNTGFVTSIGGIPAWTLVNGYLQGTAPEVTGDTSTNPSDTTTVTVYRTNSYGTSQGTLTIVINNTTAPIVTPIAGVTHEGGTALIDSDTMDDGSVVSIDNIIDVGNRFVIDKEWLDNYVLPKITSGTGDKSVFIGFPASGADWTAISGVNDFILAYEFWSSDAKRAANNWGLRVWEQGITRHNVSVGGQTSGLYDYVLINDGTDIKNGALVASQGHNASTYVYDVSDSNWRQTGGLTGVTSSNRDIVIATRGTDLDLDLQYFNEYTEPTAPTNLTNWNKALDFSGSNQHAVQVSNHSAVNPIMMSQYAVTQVNSNGAGKTASGAARPWGTAIVFKIDGNNSNQHIWNFGEGSNTSDDNIYLRVAANRAVVFWMGQNWCCKRMLSRYLKYILLVRCIYRAYR